MLFLEFGYVENRVHIANSVTAMYASANHALVRASTVIKVSK